MLGEGSLDLAELDAEAPHLDLGVDAAEEVELAVRSVAGQVAAPVEAAAGEPRHRIGDEALRRHVRPAEVPTGQAVPAEMELARNPHRQGAQAGVQYEGDGAGNGPADRRPLLVRARLRPGGVGRALRGAVEV